VTRCVAPFSMAKMAAHQPSNGLTAAVLGVPPWTSYSTGCASAPVGEGDHVLAGHVEQLAGALQALTDEVRSIESRQLTLDRRLAELDGLVQGMQEEQWSQVPSMLTRNTPDLHPKHDPAPQGGRQHVAAVEAKRAHSTAVAVQRHLEQEDELQACLEGLSTGRANQLEQSCQQHGQWIMELFAEVSALRQGQAAAGKGGIASRRDGGDCTQLAIPGSAVGPLSAWDARMTALEQKTQMIAVGARRALHTALVVHQQIQSQDHANQWEKCLESLPVTELEQSCTRRFSEQEERLDRLVHMMDSLTDRVVMQQSIEDKAYTRGAFEEMSARMEELEANVFGLATEMRQGGPPAIQSGSAYMYTSGGSGYESPRSAQAAQVRELISVALEAFEARIDRHFNELGLRIDSLQDARDQHRLTIRQLNQQLPELAGKVDQLWTQCQFYFPRVKEHDVHFSFFRSSFENHKQSMLDYADSLDHREQRLGVSLTRGLSASRTSSPPPGRSEDLASSLAASPEHRGVGAAGLLAAASVAAQAPAGGGPADDGRGTNGRSWMLAQVMERLHGARDEGRAPVSPPGVGDLTPPRPPNGGVDG